MGWHRISDALRYCIHRFFFWPLYLPRISWILGVLNDSEQHSFKGMDKTLPQTRKHRNCECPKDSCLMMLIASIIALSVEQLLYSLVPSEGGKVILRGPGRPGITWMTKLTNARRITSAGRGSTMKMGFVRSLPIGIEWSTWSTISRWQYIPAAYLFSSFICDGHRASTTEHVER